MADSLPGSTATSPTPTSTEPKKAQTEGAAHARRNGARAEGRDRERDRGNEEVGNRSTEPNAEARKHPEKATHGAGLNASAVFSLAEGRAECAVEGTEASLLEKALAVAFNCSVEDDALPVLFDSPSPARPRSTSQVNFLRPLVKLALSAHTSATMATRSLGLLSRACKLDPLGPALLTAGALDCALNACFPLIPVLPANANYVPNDAKGHAFTQEGESALPVSLSALRAAARVLVTLLKLPGDEGKAAAERVVSARCPLPNPTPTPTPADAKSAGIIYPDNGKSVKRREGSGLEAVLALLCVWADPAVQGNAALCVGSLAQHPQALEKLGPSLRPLVELMKAENPLTLRNVLMAAARVAQSPLHIEQARQLGAMHLMGQLAHKVKAT